MPSETDASFPSEPSEPKKRLGRPPNRTAAETHQQRIERLQAELQKAQEAQQANEDRRASIVGHACLRHARANAEFSRYLASALRAEIKAKADRAAITDLLGDDPITPLTQGS